MELTGLSADAVSIDKATLLANGGDDGATTLKLDTTVQCSASNM